MLHDSVQERAVFGSGHGSAFLDKLRAVEAEFFVIARGVFVLAEIEALLDFRNGEFRRNSEPFLMRINPAESVFNPYFIISRRQRL